MQSLRYTTSKLCTMLFANRLAKWLQEQDLSSKYNPIFVWGMDPGIMVGTGLQRTLPWYIRWWLRLVGYWTEGVRNPKYSAQDIWDIVHCMGTEQVHEVQEMQLNCMYFDRVQSTIAPSVVYDRDIQQDLWSVSARLTGLDV